MSSFSLETKHTTTTMNNPYKLLSNSKHFFSNLHRRFILLLIPSISLLLFFSFSTNEFNSSNVTENKRNLKSELLQSRITVCLVGGARRFELTGPSIVENVLKVYPNSDLFLNSPLDENAYKFSLLNLVPRIAGVRILPASQVPETDAAGRVLTRIDSPNGIQGLLQYFNLVEGCLTMIQSYQHQHNFTYNWIVRTRVDGYWSSQLPPELFIPKQYVIPSGSSYHGFNDRFGIGDYNNSIATLSRLSIIPELDSAEFRNLNSESAFQAQLSISNITRVTKRLVPFCFISNRRYRFPPKRSDVPVAAISSTGRLNGAKCRPCTPVCSGRCAETVMSGLDKGWSWADDGGGGSGIELCDAHGKWEDGWPEKFDRVVGSKLAAERKRMWELSVSWCVADFEEMRRRAPQWEVPPAMNVCSYGLGWVLT